MWTPPPSQPYSNYPRHAPPSQTSSVSPGQHHFNTSPTGSVHHRIPAPCRQLHPPKSPLYRPAVLRAIDRPLSVSTVSSPGTSPKSSVVEYEGNFRRGSVSSSEEGYEQWDEYVCEEDEDVKCTGPPTRAHWKPDAAATACDSPSCIREFGTWIRRHHCRRCGNVFCYEHVPYYLRLNQNGRIHPQGSRSKTCDNCYADYRTLCAARRNDSLSSQSTSSTLSNTSPIVTRGIKPIHGRPTENAMGPAAGKVGSYVGSVPRDWSWSTF